MDSSVYSNIKPCYVEVKLFNMQLSIKHFLLDQDKKNKPKPKLQAKPLDTIALPAAQQLKTNLTHRMHSLSNDPKFMTHRLSLF